MSEESATIQKTPDDVDRIWKDRYQRECEHPGFLPTVFQRAFMDVVARATSRGVYLLSELNQIAIAELGIETTMVSASAIEPDWIQSMVYNAKRAVNAAQRWAEQRTVAQQLRLVNGDELGSLIGSDRKLCTACTLHATDEGGTVYTIHAKRGGLDVALTMNARALKEAIEAAHEAGKRKTSFSEFVSSRAHLAPVQVQADPREPYYKGREALEHGYASARNMRAEELRWRNVAMEFSMKGGPGSFESMYGFVAHAQAEVAKCQAELSSDPCFGGGPLSERSKKSAQAQLARQQLDVFHLALVAAFPDWQDRLKAVSGPTEVAPDESADGQALNADPVAVAGAADTVSDRVLELARQINHHIGEKVAHATRKSGERAVEIGGRNQAWLEQQVEQARSHWANAPLNGRVIGLAQAINDRNPDVLVRTWAKEGHGIAGNEGSLAAFRSITGVNLLRLSSEARAQALYQWAQWSPEQIANHQKQLSHERIQRMSDDRRKAILADRRLTLKGAMTVTAFDDAGRVMPLKWVLDSQITSGFDHVQVNVERGNGNVFLVNRSLGQHIELSKGIASDYVHVALEIQRESQEREAFLESRALASRNPAPAARVADWVMGQEEVTQPAPLRLPSEDEDASDLEPVAEPVAPGIAS